MTTAFMNATANRDFQYGMYQFVFTSPIKKRDYFFGKFIGAATIAVIPMMGVSLGALIGPLMPWAQPERYGDIIWSGHLQGIIAFAIPNIFISGAILYALALIFRNTIVSFVGAMVILVFYGVSSGFVDDIQKDWLANLLDPFGFRPMDIITKYMTVDEKNAHGVPLQGAFLFNRVLWIGISFLILVGMYFRFSFNTRNQKAKKEKNKKDDVQLIFAQSTYVPKSANHFSWSIFFRLIAFETRSIIKNPVFIIIVIIGLINLTVNLTSFTGMFGSAQYPVTYDIIGSIKSTFYLFLMAVIIFYTGALVWKERDAGVNEIEDSMPIKTAMLFSSKVISMIISVAIILCITILAGMIAQTAVGYTRYELDVYFNSLLVMDLLSFSFLIIIALFFHYTINNRYIAYFAFVAFIILNNFIWSAFEISSNMVQFGDTPGIIYSDMNGFGPFVSGQFWFNVYWILFCIPLSIVVYAFYTRGKEMAFGKRLRLAKSTLAKNGLILCGFIVLFIICGGFVYYNTLVLNTYDSHDEERKSKRGL
jgi:ABC-2 type transport system permease protein